MITIGIPNIGTVHSNMVISLVPVLFHTNIYYQQKYNTSIVFDFVCPTGGGIDLGRNSCAERAVATNSDYLFFIDSDLEFPPDTLSKLVDADKDVIGAVYNKKGFPIRSVVPIPKEGLPENPFQIESMPTGLLLIRTAIFTLLPKPWFAYQFTEGCNECMGEDIYFCQKAKRYGFEIWCDPTIPVKHIGDYKY